MSRKLLALPLVCVLAAMAGFASAADDPPGTNDPKMTAYAQAVAKANQAIDEGRAEDARDLLDTTENAARGFEFAYLNARLDQARKLAPDKPAPDLLGFVPNPQVQARYAVLNPTNRQMVFICRDGSLRIHDLTKPKAEAKIVTHPAKEAVWSGEFSRDGKVFVSGHQNADVLVWDAQNWTIKHLIPIGGGKPVGQVAVAPDGSALAAEGGKDLELWSLAAAEPKKTAEIGPRYNFGEGLAFSPKGDEVATGGMFDILVHDARTGRQLRTMSHASYTMGLEFSPDGARIASATRGNVNKFLAVFDAQNGKLVFNQGPFPNYVVATAFSPDGKRIAAAGCENQLRLHDASTGATVFTLKRPNCGSKPAFTHDGKLLAWSEPDGMHYLDLGAPEQAAQSPLPGK